MIDVCDMMCCGIQEIAEIRSHRSQSNTLKDLAANLYRPGGERTYQAYDWTTGKYAPRLIKEDESYECPSFLIFSDIKEAKHGDALMELIHKHKLGVVVKTEPGLNPNSQNLVTVYVWRVDRDAFLAYAKELAAKAAKPKTKKAKAA